MSGLGNPLLFSQLRQQLTEEEVDHIKKEMYTDLFFDMLILFLIIHFGRAGHCGIPIFTWNFVYFAILGARSISNLVKIYIVRNFYRWNNWYSLLSFVLIDGFFLAWLIYGNVLFYSSSNDCGRVHETAVLYNLMFILIIIGYFQMLVYGLLLLCLPCLLIIIRL